jgi:hypothetical protein
LGTQDEPGKAEDSWLIALRQRKPRDSSPFFAAAKIQRDMDCVGRRIGEQGLEVKS